MKYRAFLTSLFAALFVMIGGCYQRTVATRGLGSTSATVQKPYRSNTAADRWFDDMVSTKPTSKPRTRWLDDGQTRTMTVEEVNERRDNPR